MKGSCEIPLWSLIEWSTISLLLFFALCIIGELLHPFRSLVGWSAERLIQEVSLKDSVTGETEHTHKEHTNYKALEHTDEHWAHPVLDKVLEGGHVVEKCVYYHTIGRSHEDDAEYFHDESDGASGTERRRIRNHKEEAVPRGRAEGFASQCNLNEIKIELDQCYKDMIKKSQNFEYSICKSIIINIFWIEKQTYLNVGVLGDELDEALEAVEEVAGAAEDGLDRRVLLVGLLDLFLIVLENDTDKLDKGDQECAHGDGSQVESPHPFNTLHNGAWASWVRVAREIPLTAGGGDDEHRGTHQKSVEPKVAEEGVEDGIAGIIGPLNRRKHR